MKYLIPIFLVLIFIFFQKLVEVRCSSLITNMFFVCSVGKIIGKFMWWNSYFGKIDRLYTAAYGNKSLVTYFHRFYLPFREISRILLESPPPRPHLLPPPKKKSVWPCHPVVFPAGIYRSSRPDVFCKKGKKLLKIL